MKIKSLFLTAAATAVVALSTAQVMVGPELGYTYSTMDMHIQGVSYSNQFVGGVRVGAAVDINIKNNMYLQTGAFLGFLQGGSGSYTSYQSVGNGVPSSVGDERSYRLYAVQVPLMFTFKTDFQYHPNDFTFGIGPYVNINYGGLFKRTYTTTLNGFDRPVYDDRAIRVGDVGVQHDVKPFEIGAMAAIGYEMENGVNLKVYYGMGLNNIAPTQGTPGNELKSRGAGISLSYYFNRPEQY